jgi:hypothetical protein
MRGNAIEAMLFLRSKAILDRDRKAFLASVDPRQRRFRAAQARMFDNLRRVPLASWSYTFDPTRSQVLTPDRQYDAPTWSPAHFALHYRLRGFDRQPTNLEQYPTFVQRHGQWFLASLSDYTGAGLRSAHDLWDFGPVAVVRRPNVLVLGHPSSLATMAGVAAEVVADIPRVTAVWGRGWARRAVVVVPSTQRELSRVVADFGDLDKIAAVATAEISIGTRRANPVGDRIGINPANWPKISSLGRQIVLTHELTHVATRALTTAATPSWLAEGFADYVGYLGTGIPTPFVAQDLATDIRRGKVPHRLPKDTQFNGANARLAQAYEGGWMACRLIADRYGQRALVRFYRVVGRSTSDADAAIGAAAAQVLHRSTSSFVSAWRAYLRAQLG